MSDLPLQLATGAAAAPGGDPETVAGVALNSASPEDAITNVQAAVAYTNAAVLASGLSAQTPALQSGTYSALPASTQNQLQGAGYVPQYVPPPPKPAADTTSSGSWGFYKRALSDVVSNPLTRAVKRFDQLPGIAGISTAMSGPSQAERHIERTVMDVGAQAQVAAGHPGVNVGGVANREAWQENNWLSGAGLSVLSKVFSLKEWANAWDETNNGSKFILPQVQRKVASGMDPNLYAIALKVATGASEQQIVAAADPAQQAAVQSQLSNPVVRNAVNALNAGHLSVGRYLVGESFIAQHPELGNKLSGAIDGLTDWYTDPVMIGAKAFKSQQLARFGVTNITDAERVNQDPAVKAAQADMAGFVADRDAAAFLRKYPQYEPMWDELVAQQADTQEKVAAYQASTMGVAALVKGNPAHVTGWAARGMEAKGSAIGSTGGQVGVMPHLTTVGRAKSYVMDQLRKPINFADDEPATITGLQPEDTVDGSGADIRMDAPNAFRQRGLNAANAARRFFTLVNPGGKIDLADPRAASKFRNVAMMGLTPQRADELTNVFAATNDMQLRHSIFDGMLKELAQREGAGGSASELYEEYKARFTPEEKPAYAPTVSRAGGVGTVPGQMTAKTGADLITGLQQMKTGAAEPIEQALRPAEGPVPMQANQAALPGLAPAGVRPDSGPTKIDAFTVDGHQTSQPVTPADLHTVREVPDFRVYMINTKKVGLLGRAIGPINNDFLNHFMDAWRTLTLGRVGFAVRVSMEEVARFVLASTFREYMASRMALSAKSASERLADVQARAVRTPAEAGDAALHDEQQSMFEAMTDDMPDEELKNITTPRQLIVAHARNTAMRSLANVTGRLAPADYEAAAGHLYDRDVWGAEQYAHNISAAHGNPYGGVYGESVSLKKMMNGKYVNAEVRDDGPLRNMQPGDEMYLYGWHGHLSQVAKDPWSRLSLRMRNEDPVDRLNAVADYIQQDPRLWSLFKRSAGTRDGALVNTGEVTARQAALDHAQAVNDKVDAAILAPDGTEVGGLADHLLDNSKSPSIKDLGDVPDELRPAHVRGPERLAVPAGPNGLMDKLPNKLFQTTISPMMDWMSRKPIFLHNYAVSRQAYAGMANDFRAAGMNEDNIDEIVHQSAMDRAMNLTTPYIHNPELRSQFSTLTRNLMPFWFAQEQFYKRWARTAVVAPWAFRKAQLINGGIQHSGLVHRDQNGQEYFIYPGTGAVLNLLTHVMRNATLPIGGSLTGQVNQLSPGLDRLGLPNFGPFVVAGLNEIKSRDPAFTGAIDKLEGPISANDGLIKPFVPTTLQRLWSAVDPSGVFTSAQYASAQMQAHQQLEASGHGMSQPAINLLGQTSTIGQPQGLAGKPGDYVVDGAGANWVMQGDGTWRNNSPQALQAENNRLKNWTRSIMFMRMLFGFAGPASPTAQYKSSSLNDDLIQKLGEITPTSDAINAFIAEHPDATAYTVFQTKAAGGQVPPETAAAMGFMDANQAFMQDHRQAGSYFIPQPDITGPTSLAAYQEQMKEGLRIRKSPDEFANDVDYAMAANIYFPQETLYHQMIANMPTSSPQRQQLDAQWTAWSQQFMLVNPVFADQLTSSTGSTTRAQVMHDVQTALADPRLPQGPTTDDIRTLNTNYQLWQSMVTTTGGLDAPRLSSTVKNDINLEFARWASAFAAEHPDVQGLYNKAIRPGFSASVLSQLAQGTTT